MASAVPPGLPVTERASNHTQDIDEGVGGSGPDAEDVGHRIVRAMRACDGEMYSGWCGEVGLADADVHARVRRLAEEVAAVLSVGDDDAEDGGGQIVIAGAGTSGRVAYLTALWANKLLRSHGTNARVRYLIAGGDPALFAARELAEDDAAAAVRDLRRIELEGARRIVYIGISCGLSATYVGAQVEHALESPLYSAIAVIGFNSASRARHTRVTGWNNTFSDVLRKMLPREHLGYDGGGAGDEGTSGAARCFVITPILGPEAVTGSTRLKGGSATKIILDAVVSLAAARVLKLPVCGCALESEIRSTDVARVFSGFESATRASYAPVDALARLVLAGGRAIRSGGRIFYIGHSTIGAVGLVDASEQVPTFGASPSDVTAYVDGGYDDLDVESLQAGAVEAPSSDRCRDDEELSRREMPKVSLEHFTAEFLEGVASEDLIVYNSPQHRSDDDAPADHDHLLDTIAAMANEGRCQFAIVSVNASAGELASRICGSGARHDAIIRVHIELSSSSRPLELLPLSESFRELATKHVLNVLSTGAHILAGKVYKSKMVDLRIANDKLFHRAVRLVGHLCDVDESVSRACLLRSIYSKGGAVEGDEVDLAAIERDRATEDHVRNACLASKCVPVALLLATGTFSTPAQARRRLMEFSTVRAAIAGGIPS